MQKDRDTIYSKDILAGKNVLADIQNDRVLDGTQIRTLAEFYNTWHNKSQVNDDVQSTRATAAALSGIDPDTGQRVSLDWFRTLPGLDQKNRIRVMDSYQSHANERDSKGETAFNRRYTLGRQVLDGLLSPNKETGTLALLMPGAEGASAGLDAINHANAAIEYDNATRDPKNKGRDPVDIGYEIGLRHARSIALKFGGDTLRVWEGLGVTSYDDMLEKVKTGKISRHQADTYLRLAEFFLWREKKYPPTPTPNEHPTVEQQRGLWDSFTDFIKRSLGGGGERNPSRPIP
jgi:hypothetical protein